MMSDNPALVVVSISAFGRTGPKADWLASDLTLAAASGQLVLTGDQDRPPVRISEPQVFHHAAADAAVAAVVALTERARSGRGQHVDVSAQQAFVAATQGMMLAAAVGSAEAERMAGGLRAGPYELRLVYPATDGHVTITYLFGDMIGPYTQRLMSWVHEEGHCSDELRDVDYVSFFELLYTDQLDAGLLKQATDAVAALTATKTTAELFAEARRRRLLIAPVAHDRAARRVRPVRRARVLGRGARRRRRCRRATFEDRARPRTVGAPVAHTVAPGHTSALRRPAQRGGRRRARPPAGRAGRRSIPRRPTGH